MRKYKNALRWIRGFGLVLFAVIAWLIDWSGFLAALIHVDLGYLGLYLVLYLVVVIVRVLRLQFVLDKQGIKLPRGKLYAFTVEATFLGIVTPGRLGEMAKIAYLADSGVPMSISAIVVVLERALDFLMPLVLGGVGLIYFLALWLSPSDVVVWASVGGCILVGMIVAILPMLNRVFRIIPVESVRWAPSFLVASWAGLRASFPLVWRKARACLVVCSGFLLLLNVGQIYFLARAIGIDTANVFELSFAYAAASVVAVMPVSINGLGTREASYIFLLSQVGVEAEHSMLLSLIDGVIFPVLVGGLLAAPVLLSRAYFAVRK